VKYREHEWLQDFDPRLFPPLEPERIPDIAVGVEFCIIGKVVGKSFWIEKKNLTHRILIEESECGFLPAKSVLHLHAAFPQNVKLGDLWRLVGVFRKPRFSLFSIIEIELFSVELISPKEIRLINPAHIEIQE